MLLKKLRPAHAETWNPLADARLNADAAVSAVEFALSLLEDTASDLLDVEDTLAVDVTNLNDYAERCYEERKRTQELAKKYRALLELS